MINKMNIYEFIQHTKENPLNYITYCEVIMTEHGAIIPCVGSHAEVALSYIMEKYGKTREEIDKEIPDNCLPLEWLVDKYGLIAVWYCGYMYSSAKKCPNRFQRKSLEILKKNGLIVEEHVEPATEYKNYLKREQLKNNNKAGCLNVSCEHPVSLLPHNQDIYDKCIEAINNGEHSIFYTEATGLGKSFVFMRLVYDLFRNKDRKVLYIAPKNVIWDNMKLYKEFELISDYIEMTSYMDFNTIKNKHYEYDALFIDECHHLISDIQGANILSLMNDYVNNGKYVFGFTATPKVNNKSGCVGEYFGTKIHGIEIAEAIEKGLFPKIHYALADYDTIVDDPNVCKEYSIDGTKTLLENLLQEYEYINNWLVYFSSINALNKNKKQIQKLFPDYKLFILHSKLDDNSEVLNEYNSYNGKCMLLTVSMVLEGIHPKNVQGVLLYRNVTTYNVLLQILGRICKINSKESPVFIDITNSIFNAITQKFIKEVLSSGDNRRKNSIKNIIIVNSSSYNYINLLNYLTKTVHEYRGITWNSDIDLSRKLNKSSSYVHNKRKAGYTYEQTIDEVLDAKPSYRGIEWNSDTDLSKKLGKYASYVGTKRKAKAGYTYEQIIDEVLDVKSLSSPYRGIEWNNDIDLSRNLGKGNSYVNRKRNRGYTYEQIIDEVLDTKPLPSPYRGIEWNSDADLSRKLNRNSSHVYGKRKQGYTYEQIIDEVLDTKPLPSPYRGIEWNSDTDLSKKLGKCTTYVHAKRKKGYTYEQIIDEVLDIKPLSYRGIEWNSDIGLSRKLNRSSSYVSAKLSAGYTYEQIIDEVLDVKSLSYRGIEWNNGRDLCRKLGKCDNYVHDKRKKGYTYEQIIDEVLDAKPS